MSTNQRSAKYTWKTMHQRVHPLRIQEDIKERPASRQVLAHQELMPERHTELCRVIPLPLEEHLYPQQAGVQKCANRII